MTEETHDWELWHPGSYIVKREEDHEWETMRFGLKGSPGDPFGVDGPTYEIVRRCLTCNQVEEFEWEWWDCTEEQAEARQPKSVTLVRCMTLPERQEEG